MLYIYCGALPAIPTLSFSSRINATIFCGSMPCTTETAHGIVDRAGFSACGVWAIAAAANIKVNTVATTLLIRLQFLVPTLKKKPQRSGPVVVFPRSRTEGVELQGSPLAFERLSRRS